MTILKAIFDILVIGHRRVRYMFRRVFAHVVYHRLIQLQRFCYSFLSIFSTVEFFQVQANTKNGFHCSEGRTMLRKVFVVVCVMVCAGMLHGCSDDGNSDDNEEGDDDGITNTGPNKMGDPSE